jgi:uncharacterized protein YecE (DUF72 family)
MPKAGDHLPLNTRIGCAGWSIPKEYAKDFPQQGSHLERYAQRLNAVEINSSFYRPHLPQTYAKWAEAVPEEFGFSVKMPKEITHLRRLKECGEPLERFLKETQFLGQKLGAVLVQLPPSLVFERAVAEAFWTLLRESYAGGVACEPRHASWFNPEAGQLLADFQTARVAADPAPVPEATKPGGWEGLTYYRLHGSPRMYYSSYSEEALNALTQQLEARQALGTVWCVFDNTAEGAATGNALAVARNRERSRI